jgi:hypothetical protein
MRKGSRYIFIEISKKVKKTDTFNDSLNDVYNEIQTPILIALLYFIFQMPYLNTILFSRFSFLNLYHPDGNINFNGILIKSVLFGISFYSLMKAVDFISEI